MVSSPRLLTLDFNEGIQAEGAGIRSDHDDLVRIVGLHPRQEALHLRSYLLGEGLRGFKASRTPNRILKKNPTVSIREAKLDRHCAEN